VKVRQDIERRLAEKDEEFNAIKKTHQRALDAMQQVRNNQPN